MNCFVGLKITKIYALIFSIIFSIRLVAPPFRSPEVPEPKQSKESERGDTIMCGGYQLLLDGEAVTSLPFGATWRAGHRERHSARNSIRPTNFAPVLVHRAFGTEDAAIDIEVAMMKVSWDSI